MACRKRFAAWKRAWRRTVATARGILLAVVGIGLLAAGIVLRTDDIRLILVMLGVGVLALGIVLPLVGEFVLGPGGLTFKQAFRERDAQFQPFVLAESEESSLQRFARLLTGDAERAPAVVEEALARTYRVWTDIPERDLNLHVLCALVRVALGAGKLRLIEEGRASTSARVGASPVPELPPTLPPPPTADESVQTASVSSDDVSKTAEGFASLPMDLRAILLLRHIQDLDEPHIAWIFDRPVAAVTESLHRAEATLEERVGMAKAGSA